MGVAIKRHCARGVFGLSQSERLSPRAGYSLRRPGWLPASATATRRRSGCDEEYGDGITGEVNRSAQMAQGFERIENMVKTPMDRVPDFTTSARTITTVYKLHPSLANFHRWQSRPWTIKWAYRYWVREHDLSRFSKHYLLLYTKDTLFYKFSSNSVKALIPVTYWTSSLAKRITNALNPVLERFAPIILVSVLQWVLLGKSLYISLNTVLYRIFLLEKCASAGYNMLPYEDFAFAF